jgi:hypothetical protein
MESVCEVGTGFIACAMKRRRRKKVMMTTRAFAKRSVGFVCLTSA